MNDLSPPATGPAVETDVLATIRRLLAQDAAQQTSSPRSGPLRRRLNSPRRRDAFAEGAQTVDDPLFLTEVVPPLRLADHQHVRNRVEDRDTQDALPAEADAIAEGAAYPFTLPAFDMALGLAYMADGKLEPSMVPASPRMSAPEPPGAALSSPWQPRDLPAALPDDMAWLKALPSFPARVVAADPDPSAPEGEATAVKSFPAPRLQELAPTAPEGPALPNSGQIRQLVREALQQELAGEAGTRLGNAIQNLTRRAVADALADIARNMTGMELSEAGHGT